MVAESKIKQTEIGLIPEDWEVMILNDISKITRLAGYEYSTLWEETANGEIVALRGFNIGSNKIIEKDLVRISNKLSMRLIRSRLFTGDVIYPCVGTIGNAVVIDEDDKYHIQQNIAKITPQRAIIDSKFLVYYLMSDFGLKEVDKFNGSSSQPNILVGSLRKYSIIIPPLSEQKAIAEALSDADAWIESLEQLIAKKRLIKQGAMQELLTPNPETSGAWEVKKLGEVCEFFKGRNLPKSELSENGNFECIHYGELFTKYNENINQILSKTNINNNIVYSKENDVLMPTSDVTPRGLATASCIKKDGVILGGDILIIRFKNEINGVFFSYFITNNKEEVLKYVSGSTVYHLYGSELSNLKFVYPKSIEEQTRIATILSDMDAELEALETQLAKAQQIKQGMMQELLTGRVRLV